MQSNKIVSITIGVVFIGIAVYLAINLIDVSQNLIAKTGIGWVAATIVTRALVCFSFARGIQIILKSLTPKINSILVFIGGLVLGFAISFLSPIYQSDYGDFSTTDLTIDHKGLTEITNGKYQIKKQPHIIVFFTTNCPHCKEASERLGFLSQLGKLPPIVAIFPGNKENTQKFLAKHKGQTYEYYRLDENEDFFLDNSGAGFPSVFLINEKGETVKHWFGDLLNYSALDYLGSLKN
ncbi:MAG: peroxiredoxin family protein [Crocinitomicaceae bacterium]